ncbi:EscU/YscU/HrcU family type III secretion system export apparatus switch protein [Chengkuizengella sediminis]|uniref:EscU/YscU/HrcU family type III secretion system export apparatus switch protein n=1 Tax=Chengkuizengella sediminis TaxID=1885917 RepID=UPI00138A0314|nr:EscU/YscU/HrcU family type III secretion system export apparatus switch protein [Chengkuizengella sediminis]NDI33408.1 FhlB domain-containing protein [Chengkuizengella sediminis]
MNKNNRKITKAVALSYSSEQNDAPELKAKGKGIIADNIIEKAKSYGVPIQEDASLVEVLSKLEINEEIPAELYQLVAEVLTMVYEADQKAKMLEVFKP